MNKSKIKQILISLQNEENYNIVTNLLGKIDLLDDKDIDRILKQIGYSEDSIKSYLKNKINKHLQKNSETHTKHKPINKMFTYGISESCIHLHLPGDLHQSIKEIGISKTIAKVHLYLLDAIDKIKYQKDNGNIEFSETEKIYMISPIISKSELGFFEDLGFSTNFFSKQTLANSDFVSNDKGAQLAIRYFGNDKNVSSALIYLKQLSTIEYQEAKKKKINEINKLGITLDDEKEI